MKNRIIWRDIIRNKIVTSTTILFIAVAAMLLSLGAILIVNLFGAIDQLMEVSKTPHFMQMHSGEIDILELEDFAEKNNNVKEFQILHFLNVDNTKISIEGNSLADSLQDNGFCVQSETFDFLLDLNNNIIKPKIGEVYVPVCYLKDGTAKLGDFIVIDDKSFLVAGFVRDSQMNSALASSKRFVINETDYDLLEQSGSVEYLIEFRLNNLSELGKLEAAYSKAKLPANGPTLTWPLFRMISAVSDGIMIAVIIVVSILVIFITLFCIRFTLLAKIEEDYREIGVMKAIGMRVSDIRTIYLTTYAVISAAGCIIGFLCSLLFRKPMSESIRLNLGDGGNDKIAFLLGVVGVLLMFCFILLYVTALLRRFHKISAAQAIRFGVGEEKIMSTRRIQLSNNKWLSINLFLGIKDVLARKRMYVTILIVMVLASFIMIVPQNLYHTISGKNFVTYMGVGRCDLRVDIQQINDIEKKSEIIKDYMKQDSDMDKYTVLTTKIFGVKLENSNIGNDNTQNNYIENGNTRNDNIENNRIENIKVELGDHTIFPVQYASGRMPMSETEIALSSINAEELGKTIGDEIILLTENGERRLSVCGIYSDITNGGKTAKATFKDNSKKAAWSVINASVTDAKQIASKLSEYKNQFDFAKISSIDEYVTRTFGQTLQSVRMAGWITIVIAIAITMLISLLFIKLLVTKDVYSIAVIKSIGFTNKDVRRQYTWRVIFILFIGVILGTILAGTLGEKLAAMAISSFGATTFQFTINPIFTYLFSPIIMFFTALSATVLGTAKAGEVYIYKSIKE